MNKLHQPKVNFTTISNRMLGDKELSLKAKGLLSFMLSKPDKWNFSIRGISSQLKEGVEAIQNTLQELIEQEYVIRGKLRNKGRFTGYAYTLIFEKPCPKESYTEKPYTAEPYTETPDNSNTIQSKTRKSNTGSKNISPSKFDEYFDTFWESVPRLSKIGKKKAKSIIKSILKREEADWKTLIHGMKEYKRFCERTKRESKYIKHPVTWLNHGCWNDEYPEPRTIKGEYSKKAEKNATKIEGTDNNDW